MAILRSTMISRNIPSVSTRSGEIAYPIKLIDINPVTKSMARPMACGWLVSNRFSIERMAIIVRTVPSARNAPKKATDRKSVV